jgi:hypothetical protein
MIVLNGQCSLKLKSGEIVSSSNGNKSQNCYKNRFSKKLDRQDHFYKDYRNLDFLALFINQRFYAIFTKIMFKNYVLSQFMGILVLLGIYKDKI